jgi:hypothetical protein
VTNSTIIHIVKDFPARFGPRKPGHHTRPHVEAQLLHNRGAAGQRDACSTLTRPDRPAKSDRFRPFGLVSNISVVSADGQPAAQQEAAPDHHRHRVADEARTARCDQRQPGRRPLGPMAF